jgi:hypothetical protein
VDGQEAQAGEEHKQHLNRGAEHRQQQATVERSLHSFLMTGSNGLAGWSGLG